MKIAIYTKGENYITEEEIALWSTLSKKYSFECFINDTGSDTLTDKSLEVGLGVYKVVGELSDIDFVVSYGGDGNFLYTIENFRGLNIPIIGINSGRLGFLANVPRSRLEDAISAVLSNKYSIEERPLIEVRRGEQIWYAFNEFTLQKRGFGMVSAHLDIDGEYVGEYLADGLIISSPSGSTAYSMSVGGAIIAPNCGCFIITPIAPHNLNMRPLIINDLSQISVYGKSRNNSILITTDNRSYEAVDSDIFHISRSSYSVKLIKLEDNSFYKTIREKLMWGVDARNICSAE